MTTPWEEMEPEDYGEDEEDPWWICDVCGCEYDPDETGGYCPDCGH